jgi:hypothetical protein
LYVWPSRSSVTVPLTTVDGSTNPSGTLLLDSPVSLLLELTAELEEFVSFSLLLLDFAELLLDFTDELLDLESLDCFVSLSKTLEELLDFAFELLEPSQSSQIDEDESSPESIAELLSSPQATSTAATKPIVKNFFKVIKILQLNKTNIDKSYRDEHQFNNHPMQSIAGINIPYLILITA